MKCYCIRDYANDQYYLAWAEQASKAKSTLVQQYRDVEWNNLICRRWKEMDKPWIANPTVEYWGIPGFRDPECGSMVEIPAPFGEPPPWQKYVFLGPRLKQLRKERKVLLIQLSSQIGISTGFLSDIENQKRNPSLVTLAKIAAYYEIDMSSLLHNIEIEDFGKEN